MDSFEWKSEEEEFSILLKSMGVKSCDKYVITALSDYAKSKEIILHLLNII